MRGRRWTAAVLVALALAAALGAVPAADAGAERPRPGPGPAPATDAAGPFPDVPAGSAFAEPIAWMVANGLTTGYPDGGFHPTAPVTRQAGAAFVHRYGRAEADPTTCTAAPLPDIGPSHPFCVDIAWLLEHEITTGYPDGDFHATAPISRQAMAAFLARLRLPAPRAELACDAAPLPDVPVDHPFCGEIAWLVERGITTGYPDGGFHPAAPVSRQAMAAFLARLDPGCQPADERPGCPRAAVDGDFDGDRRTDIAWTEERTLDTLTWWQLDATEPFATTHPVPGSQTSGDYDGDGRWDPAWLDQRHGLWMTQSAAGDVAFPPPACGDPQRLTALPVSGDWDGDRRTDPGWYCPLDATWHLPGQDPIVLGRPEDPDQEASASLPAPGDYDGDGTDDPAVFDPVDGTWWVAGHDQPIADGMGFGLPVPADYDGDGDDDPMLWTYDGWWEASGALPEPGPGREALTDPDSSLFSAPGDYDGDGTHDRAVVARPSSDSDPAVQAQWFIDGQDPLALPDAFSLNAAMTEVLILYIPAALLVDRCNRSPAGEGCPRPFVAGDLDGDGAADPVWLELPAEGGGTWWWGDDPTPLATAPAGTIPVTADFDGNGRWEPAWVDPTTGDWHTTGRAGTLHLDRPACAPTPFDDGALPVPGNFVGGTYPIQTGHSADEPAWWCPSDATWHFADGATKAAGTAYPAGPVWADGSALAASYYDIALPGDRSDGIDSPLTYGPDDGVATYWYRADWTPTIAASTPLALPLAGTPWDAPPVPVWRITGAVLQRDGQADWTPTIAALPGVTSIHGAVADLDGDGQLDGMAVATLGDGTRRLELEGSPPLTVHAGTARAVPVTLPTAVWRSHDRIAALEAACWDDGVCPPGFTWPASVTPPTP